MDRHQELPADIMVQEVLTQEVPDQTQHGVEITPVSKIKSEAEPADRVRGIVARVPGPEEEDTVNNNH